MNKNRTAKVAIASCIRELMKDSSSLAIDTGSNSGYVAQALRRRKNLTIVTNSAYIASTLAMIEGNRVFMAGTQLRNHDGAAFDRAAYDVIASLTVEHAILPVSSVHPTRGFLAFDQCEIDIARAMIDISAHTIMAVDVTKFSSSGTLPSLRLPGLRPDNLVVTDTVPEEAFADVIDTEQFVVAGSL